MSGGVWGTLENVRFGAFEYFVSDVKHCTRIYNPDIVRALKTGEDPPADSGPKKRGRIERVRIGCEHSYEIEHRKKIERIVLRFKEKRTAAENNRR